MRKRAVASGKIDLITGLANQVNDALELHDLAASEDDQPMLAEVAGQARELEQRIGKAELQRMLSGPVDHSNAIVSIHPGSGGTEAKDWGAMLLRMYLRWCERR